MIRYEYPLNERIRTLLRLEDLFDRLAWYARGEHAYEHHAALITLFEIAEIASRSDLKTDLLQELERQRAALSGLRDNPGVQQEKLDGVLGEIETAHVSIHRMSGKAGQHLKEDEWLMAVKQRAVIPGGLCEFDLPAYHYWLHASVDTRRQDLQRWLLPILPLRAGFGIVLRLLRESCRPAATEAPGGLYQKMIEAGTKPPQMIRIGLAESVNCVPEISANKYMLNVRFIHSLPGESKTCADTVTFELSFCSL